MKIKYLRFNAKGRSSIDITIEYVYWTEPKATCRREGILFAFLYLYISFYRRVVNFCRNVFSHIDHFITVAKVDKTRCHNLPTFLVGLSHENCFHEHSSYVSIDSLKKNFILHYCSKIICKFFCYFRQNWFRISSEFPKLVCYSV